MTTAIHARQLATQHHKWHPAISSRSTTRNSNKVPVNDIRRLAKLFFELDQRSRDELHWRMAIILKKHGNTVAQQLHEQSKVAYKAGRRAEFERLEAMFSAEYDRERQINGERAFYKGNWTKAAR